MQIVAPKSSPSAPAITGASWPENGLESVAACPVCTSAGRELLHRGLQDRVSFCAPGEWSLYRCTDCGTGYLDPRPDAASISLAYSRYYTHNSAGKVGQPPRSWWRRHRTTQRNAYLNSHYGYQLSPGGTQMPRWLSAGRRRRFDRYVCFLRFPGKGARVLDIGCGNGRVLLQLRAAGWEVSGIEPDEKSAAQAVATGLDVRAGLLKPGDWPDGYFDAITMNHVIEHLHDPIALLRVCGQLLKPGGQISVTTPNLLSRGHQIFGPEWFGLQSPTHLVLFTPDSLGRALETCGFRLEAALRLEPIAGEMFRKSMQIRLGGDPRTEQPPLPLDARLKAMWLAWNANRAAQKNPGLAESVVLLGTRN